MPLTPGQSVGTTIRELKKSKKKRNRKQMIGIGLNLKRRGKGKTLGRFKESPKRFIGQPVGFKQKLEV